MNEVVDQQMDFLKQMLTWLIILTLIIVILVICYFRYTLTKPLQKLAGSAQTFVARREEKGSKEPVQTAISDLTIKSNDEIRDLYDSIRQMETDINQYIQNITAVTAEKERIGAELNITIQIQSSMLPCIFPPSPVKVSSILSQENSVMSMQDTKYRLSARKTKVLFVGDAPQFDDITMLCLDYKKRMEVDAQ